METQRTPTQEETDMAHGTITHDERCSECGEQPQSLTCSECGQSARITDCGHQAQPRPIAAGRADGTAMHRVFCAFCARLNDEER